MKKWIIPAYSLAALLVFVDCWAPLFAGLVSNPLVASGLGMLSACPIVFAVPFIGDRLVRGRWTWEMK